MQKYKSNIISTTGAAIRNVPVMVLTDAGELASLYLDRAGAIAAPNPLTTDSAGNFYFYAVNGRYSLRTTVEGVTITDDDVVLLQDPEEITVAGPIAEAVAAAEAAAKQAQDAVKDSGIPQLVAAAQNAVVDAGEALMAAQAASKDAAAAKSDAEAAKGAAEQAGRDAQAAAGASDTAAVKAASAAQSAAQSAASIDPASIYQAIGKKVDALPNAGLMTDTERQKLGGIEAGGTKNSADAQLRDRSTHTGLQSISTIEGLRAELDARVQQTSPAGVALLPQGGNGGLPTVGSIPAGYFLLRGSTEDPTDYRPEFWNRVAAAWQTLSSREWIIGYVSQLFQRIAALESAPKPIAPGSAPQFVARAWVNFNGATIRASGNISSITKSGAGVFIANLTTPLPDANGAAVCTGSQGGVARLNASTVMLAANQCRMEFNQVSVGNIDPDNASLVVFR